MKRKIIFTVFLVLVITSSCKKEHTFLSKNEKKRIEGALNYIVKNNNIGLTNCYLIKPYFSDFNISSFFESPDTSFINLFKERSTDAYLKIQNTVNHEFAGKYNSDFEQLSTCNKSNFIIRFSGFSENMVIGYLEESNREVSKDELRDKVTIKHNETIFYFFIYNDEGNIVNVLEDVLTFW